MDVYEWSEEHIHKCICGGIGWLRVPFAMDHPLFGQLVPCLCKRDEIKVSRTKKMMRLSGLSEMELSQWKFEAFYPEKCVPESSRHFMGRVKEAAIRFASEPHGFLVLQGAYGSGKTHLAYAIARESIIQGKGAYAAPATRMLQYVRNGIGDDVLPLEQRLAFLMTVNLLVIDDLGSESRTPWTDSIMFDIINQRYSDRLPIVITTNLDLATCDYEPRIVSRLSEGASLNSNRWSKHIVLPAQDYRPYKEESCK
jgi:DNA replication protein DnaC